jgi:hypothetical protein
MVLYLYRTVKVMTIPYPLKKRYKPFLHRSSFKHHKLAARHWIGLLVLLALCSCNSPGNQSKSSPSSVSLYLPPTPAYSVYAPATQTIPNLPENTPSLIVATPIPTCVDSLVFIEDLTIPDGSTTNPGEQLDKQWRVENAGTCNWDSSYRMQLIAGPALQAPSEQALYPARSGSRATIRIIFTAPAEPGRYRSAWQAVSPQGILFGDPIFIEFIVETPTPTSTP